MIIAWLLLGLCLTVSVASPTLGYGSAAPPPPLEQRRGSPRVFKWLSEGSIQNLFQGNEAEVQTIPGIYDTVCTGSSSETFPSGSCVNLATCLFSGGAAAPDSRDCGAFEGICCNHRLSCQDTMVSRVAYWESEDYPQLSSKAGNCILNIRPIRNACYIRVEFEDTVLTSARADSCEGNTLTIGGQKDGTSGVLCGNLKNTETLVRVTEGMTGPFRVYDDVIMHMDIQDKWHKYKIKLTQIKCNQNVKSPVRLTRRGRSMGGLWLTPSENGNITFNTEEEEEDFRVRQIRNSLSMKKLLKQIDVEETDGENSTEEQAQNVEIPMDELVNNVPSNHLGEHLGDHGTDRQMNVGWWQSLTAMFNSNEGNSFKEFFEGVQPLRTVGNKERPKNIVSGCKFDNPILCSILEDEPENKTNESKPISTTAASNEKASSENSTSQSNPSTSAPATLPEESNAVLPTSNTDKRSASRPGVSATSTRVITMRKAAALLSSDEITETKTVQQRSGEEAQPETNEEINATPSVVGTEQVVIPELNVTDRNPDSLETTTEGDMTEEYEITTSQPYVGGIRERVPFPSNDSQLTDSSQARNGDTNYASRIGDGFNGASLRHVHPVNFVQPEHYDSSLSVLSDSLLSMLKTRDQGPKNEHFDGTYSDDQYEYFRDVGIGSLNQDDRTRQVYEYDPTGEWKRSSISKIRSKSSPPKIYELSLTEVLARMPQQKLERYALDLQKHSELSEDLLLQKLNELVFGEIQARNPIPRRPYNDQGGQSSQKSALVTSDTGFAILVSPIRTMPELSNPQSVRSYAKHQLNNRDSSTNYQYPPTDSKNYQESLANQNRFPTSGSNNYRSTNTNNNNFRNSFSNIPNNPTTKDFNELLETVNILQNNYKMNENNFQNVAESNLNLRPTFDNYGTYPSNSNSQQNAFVGALSGSPANNIRFNSPPGTQQGQNSQVYLPSSSLPAKMMPFHDLAQLQQLTQDEPFRTEKEASYYGFMVLKNEADEYYFCSATLISSMHALTSASCVLRKGYAMEPYRIHVVFSNDDLGPTPGRSGAALFNHPNHKRVKKVTFHPLYKHNNFHYDIAVLTLEFEVANSKPIKMALPDIDIRDRPLTLMGHGARPSPRLSFDSFEQHLTYISARYLNFDSCSENYDSSKSRRYSYLEKLIKPEMLCLLSTEGTQLCEGDQGGPVVIDFMMEKREPQLVGLASGNNNNCINVARSELGMYPDVAVRLTWPIIEFIEMATSDFSFRE